MSKTGHENLRGFFEGIPAVYLYLFCQAAKKLGIREDTITAGFGLSQDELLAPQKRISLKTGYLAASRGAALGGNIGLGMAYARELKPTMHGSLGMLAMTSETLADALKALTRYVAIRAPFFKFRVSERGDQMLVVLEPVVPMEPMILTMMTESVLFAGANMVRMLQPEADVLIELDFAEPPYAKRFSRDFDFEAKFGSGLSAIVLPKALANGRTQLSDASSAEIARRQCELEYRSLFPESETLADQIKRFLGHFPTGQSLPSLEVVAERFHLSARTLRRRLAELDTSFRTIHDAEILRRAQDMLEETDLSVSEVAYELGYPSVSNFSASFKRMTGATPKAYREAARSSAN